MFVDREREIEFLEKKFAAPGAEFLVIWGRRRVGKTAVLQHFSRDRRVLYHTAARTTVVGELARFSGKVSAFFSDPLPAAQAFASWEAALAYLASRAEAEPFGLVFDEFPNLCEGDASLPSLLQIIWDERLSRTPLKLVVCGSSIGMMERTFFSPTAPLYGRRTGQWQIAPFSPAQLRLMFPGKNMSEVLEAYCVVGGAPMYSVRFDLERSLRENIREHILTKGEMMYEEVPYLLRQELREPRTYQAILSAIATGATKFSEISSKTGLDRGHATRYLTTLAELGLVEREVPVTERHPEKSKKGRYRIADNFIRFWYSFVFPNLTRLEANDAESVLTEAITPEFDSYVGQTVETAVASLLLEPMLRQRIPFDPVFAGRQWGAGGEFDVVVLDADRTRALVTEVKWSRKPVRRQIADGLTERIQASPVLRELETFPCIVSRSGFSRSEDAPEKAVFIDLSTL